MLNWIKSISIKEDHDRTTWTDWIWNHCLAKMNIRFDRPKLIFQILHVNTHISRSKWTFDFFFNMHWQDNMCKPENDMSQYILLTFYYSILFGIRLRTNEKEFRVHIIYWKNSLSVYIYLCLLHVVFTVRVLVPVGIPYSFRRYPDNETGSYIHHAVHETWYDGHWSRQHCSSHLCDQ